MFFSEGHVQSTLQHNIKWLNNMSYGSKHNLINSSKVLFSTPSSKISLYFSAVSLLSHLYVYCQVRYGDLDTFFSHENQSFPPSLSSFDDIRPGTKSDVLSYLEKMCPPETARPEVDALLIDGAVIVQNVKAWCRENV